MPVLVGDSVVELSVDEALDDEVMVTKVVGVGVADVDDEESDEDASLPVAAGLSVDDDDWVLDALLSAGVAVVDASLLVALADSGDEEDEDGSLLVGVALAVEDDD